MEAVSLCHTSALSCLYPICVLQFDLGNILLQSVLSLLLPVPSVQLRLMYPNKMLCHRGFHNGWNDKRTLKTVVITCHVDKSCVVCTTWLAAGGLLLVWVVNLGWGYFLSSYDCVFGGRSRHQANMWPGTPDSWVSNRSMTERGCGKVDSFALTLVGSALPFHCSPQRLC